MDNKSFEKLLREYGANNKSEELEKLIDKKNSKEACVKLNILQLFAKKWLLMYPFLEKELHFHYGKYFV